MDYQIESFCKLICSVLHKDADYDLEHISDWTSLVKMAREHNLLPVFMEKAVQYSKYIERPEYLLEMQEVLSEINSQVKRTNAFLKIYDVLRKNGVCPIVMKGIICRELYGELCDHRISIDEDVLIRYDEYWKAKSLLLENGYVTNLEGETEQDLKRVQEVSFVNEQEGLHIELHLNPMGHDDFERSRMSNYFTNVFDDIREVTVQGVSVYTMSHENHLLYLILHAFKHFTGGGFGIRQMLDILLYQQSYSCEIDMTWLGEKLQDFKALLFWNDIVCIGNMYLGFNLQLLRKANCPQDLLEDAIHRGTFGNNTQEEMIAARAITFATGNNSTGNGGNSIKMVWKAVFPNKIYLLDNSPYLENKPWLLPLAWLQRWGRFIKKSKASGGNLTGKSMKISQERLKLMKKYDLV